MPIHWFIKTLIGVGIGFAAREARTAISNRRSKKEKEKEAQRQRHCQRPLLHLINVHVPVRSDHGQKDLQNSISFFEEGIGMLQLALDKISCGNTDANKKKETKQTNRLRTDNNHNGLLDGFFRGEVQDIAEDVMNLKSCSGETFSWAKLSFKNARDDATRAFNNEALSTKDRILAAKLRIMSAIFGCLEEPDTATVACKIYLNELNGLADVSKQFNAHFGPMKYAIKKDSGSILTSVCWINYMVFCFTETLAKHLLNVDNWPRIKIIGDLYLHPIRCLGLNQIILKTEEINFECRSLSLDQMTDPVDIAVNSKGEFIVTHWSAVEGNSVKVFSNTGEFQLAFSPSKEEMKGRAFKPRAVTSDEGDNIYVYAEGEGGSGILTGEVIVFDREGKLKRQIPTECGTFMTLQKKSNKIVLSGMNGIHVYESDGKLVNSIRLPDLLGSANPIAVSNEGDIIVTDTLTSVVHVFTAEHQKLQFKVDQAGGWKYVAFNHVTDEIIVSYLSKDISAFQLESYSKNGRLLGTMRLPEEYPCHPRALAVTPNGRIAVLYQNNVHLI